MTDSRTTELREKLTERGVDWIDESNGYADVTTFIANGAKWTVISKSYLNPEHDWMTLRGAEHITPEQAIAAALGGKELERENSKLEHKISNMETKLLKAQERINELITAATLGSEHEAKLIQAMEDVLRHSTDTVWVGKAETLVDRMVSLGVYKHDVYEGIRPWEVDA